MAFASSARALRGQPGRRALPRPPDQHEAQAARRRVSTRRPTAPPTSPPPSDAVSRSTARGTARTTRAHVDDETRQFPIDPVGPRVTVIPGVGIVTSGLDAGKGADDARPLPPRDRRPGRCRRARRVPLAQRGGGVRDRVLAARALQARAGAPARRAVGAHRRGHGRGQRDRPCDRATARLARRARRGRRPERATARGRSRTSSSQAYGTRRALAVEVDVTSEDDVVEMVRRTVLEYGGLDVLVASAGLATSAVGDRDHARRLGAELRRPRPRLLPRRARGVPRPDRAGPRRLDRLRRLQERARRRGERRRVLLGEGGGAPPRALPRRGGRLRTGSASTP